MPTVTRPDVTVGILGESVGYRRLG